MLQHFHVNTPLLESVSMSKMAGTAVYLKMENCQPSGSFKIRGVGHLCQQVGAPSLCLDPLCLSAADALCVVAARQPLQGSRVFFRWERWDGRSLRGPEDGAAGDRGGAVLHPPTGGPQAAGAGRRRQGRREGQSHPESGPWVLTEDVVSFRSVSPRSTSGGARPAVPLTSDPWMLVVSNRQVWDDANAEALRLAETEQLTFVPPFDHPLLWEGHASVVAEAAAALGPGARPGAVLLSVGGGGLLCGVVCGLKDAGWADVPVIAMETVGADCFNAAIKAGELVTLDDITSEAKCLGAKTVCRRAFELSQSGEATIISELVTDQEALRAVQMFLDEERVLVEMACGAALAAIYSGLIPRLQAQGRLPTPLRPLLVIVCGGSSINMEQLISLQQKLQS
ncbi:PREDICTED: serine dehydratase-like isoform X1 [Poecilia mexicana]|uniref:serine dehydratase-like isoform X1 n=1 Tax=Poecilia mexicana TaxID=48701 RepID=UPI00072E3CB3|nr:PREDICTED: serine dehydratase-like isoform X1 [Poecilia mexicana]XP_014823634.1 PREDICTED: serine dehydratase-like isoform X1 [Poecilia mexicana]